MAEGGEVLGDGAPRGAVVLSRQCRFREGGAEHEAAVHATRGSDNGGEGEVRVSIDGKRVAEVSCVGWGFRSNRATMPFPWTIRSCAWATSIHPFFPNARAYRVVGSLGAEPSTSPTRPLVSSPSSSSRPLAPPDSLTACFLPPFSRPSPPNPKAVSLPPPPRSPSTRGVLRGSFGRGGVGDGRCGLNADEFDDDAEAEPTVGLFGRSIRGLAEVNFTAVAGGREEGKAIVMAGSGLSLLSGSGNVLPFVLASPSSSQKIPHCWLHR
uniref:Uncharacterized protein n=2 Tax=Oryza TaxID=4527 RepID=A0A0E0P171_ORYRU